ncbi:MAG: hypothetical protein QG599_2006 [Pseudomonadota bacterium]|nr:hypothetical protein [Pseudomonadota bacterium]
MMYITGTIADVLEDGLLTTLVVDTGRRRHHLQAESRLLSEALSALYGEDCIGKAVAVQCDGATLTSIEIPGVAPNYSI